MNVRMILPVGADPRWPAGRPASARSAFFQTQDGSVIGGELENTQRARRRSTGTVERLRRQGRDNSTIVGLSPKQEARDAKSSTSAAAQYMRRARNADAPRP